LWPEQRSLGLFPGQCWLSVGKQVARDTTSPESGGLLNVADGLLLRLPSAGWPRPSLDVLLSDEMSRSIVLPWQDGLRTRQQQLRYAEVCLGDAGVPSTGWTVQQGYRRYGCAGIAYAVPSETLQQLAALASARHLRLRSVLPASAAAFWREPHGCVRERVVLLEEKRRVCALRLGRDGLMALDVQPVIGSPALAVSRLLRRLQLQTQDVATVVCWSVDPGSAMEALAKECFPHAQFRRQFAGGQHAGE